MKGWPVRVGVRVRGITALTSDNVAPLEFDECEGAHAPAWDGSAVLVDARGTGAGGAPAPEADEGPKIEEID